MKNLNKKTEFDKHWEEAFQNAEATPPDSIWSRIDSELSKEEAGYFKRRAFMFKMLAAASITFALGIGIFSLNYYMDNRPETPIVQTLDPSERDDNLDRLDNSPLTQKKAPQRSNTLAKSESQESGLQQSTRGKQSNSSNTDATTEHDRISKTTADQENFLLVNSTSDNLENVIVPPSIDDDREGIQTPVEIDEESEATLALLNSLTPRGINFESDEEMLYEIDHIYSIPFMPRGASKKNKNRDDDSGVLMASLDFSAGQFNPNFQQETQSFSVPNGYVASDTRTEVAPLVNNRKLLLVRSIGQKTEPELEYSYGGNIGFKLSKRFLLQTGFAYRKASTTTSTTGYLHNPADGTNIPIVASYQYQLEGLSSVKIIEETNLKNQYEFASIPVRAGYVLLKRKVNVTLLAGISSEIFINNSITNDNDYLQSLSSNDASESPFNNLYFNGSVGTMVGYSFAKNYMVTVEPSYRMAINSFTKESFYLSSYPSSFMLSFGVAYNFR